MLVITQWEIKFEIWSENSPACHPSAFINNLIPLSVSCCCLTVFFHRRPRTQKQKPWESFYLVRSQWKHVTSSGGWNICAFFPGGILIVREGVPTGSEVWKKRWLVKGAERLSEEVAAWRGTAARDETPSQCVYVCVKECLMFQIHGPISCSQRSRKQSFHGCCK